MTMTIIEEAIECAFKKDIEVVYKILSTSVLAAKENIQESNAAQQRFKKGLEYAVNVRNIARSAAGLPI